MFIEKNSQFLGLFIDTSTERGIAALFNDHQLIWNIDLPIGLQNSKTLIPTLVKAFEELNLNPSQLSLISTGIGPGSYTGIRVGVCVAKALSFARKIPLIGICSLSGFIPNEEGKFLSLIDARIGGYYCQTGVNENGVINNLSEPFIRSLEEIEPYLRDTTFIVTPNLSVKTKIITVYPYLSCHWIEKSPNPDRMAQLTKMKYENDDFTLDGHLEVLYLRKTQAELEKKVNPKESS